MRQWLAGIVVGAVAGGLTAASVVLLFLAPMTRAAPEDQIQQLLRVRFLEVVDADGAPRASFFVDDQGIVGLSLDDQDGNERLKLNVRRDVVNMLMKEPNDERRVTLALAAAGRPPEPYLGLSDRRDAAVWLSVDRSERDGSSHAWAFVRAATNTNAGGFVVTDSDGKILWDAP
jgi:hypothetical protein